MAEKGKAEEMSQVNKSMHTHLQTDYVNGYVIHALISFLLTFNWYCFLFFE